MTEGQPTPSPDIYWESSELALKVSQGKATPQERKRHEELLLQLMSDQNGPEAVFMYTAGEDLITTFGVKGPRVVSEKFFNPPVAKRESRLKRGVGWVFRLMGK